MIDSALRDGTSKVFAVHLTQMASYEIADLRLGKKIEALREEAVTLYKQINRYVYGAPTATRTAHHPSASPRATSTRPVPRACSSSS